MTQKTQQTLEVSVYSKEGKEVEKLALPAQVFGAPWNADLVHEVAVAMQGNARANTAHTKDRSEVRGGGKKPWKQKGTGRARHGSSRSPIWSGGGVAHGPRNERDYTRKINKNMKAKALATVLSQKLSSGQLIFVDALAFPKPKTKEAIASLVSLSKAVKAKSLVTKKANAAIVVLPSRDEQAELSFRNMQNVEVTTAKDVSLVELLTYKYVVVAKPAEALKTFTSRTATKSARKVTAKAQ